LTTLFSDFWGVFSISFIVALPGAMSPGPMLTYTLIKSAKTNKHGYLTGAWIILGHAVIEFILIILLLLGFSYFLKNILVVKFIAVAGGITLVLFGFFNIKSISKGRFDLNLSMAPTENEDSGLLMKERAIENPVVGGIFVSISNPYLWVWWGTIGFALMVQYEITFSRWPYLIAFFAGHELGDLLWYLIISTLAFFGLKKLNRKVYKFIFIGLSLVLIIFGLYLGITPFISTVRV
jgi:threonine/homoserine/homoserine lactone efflux protein